MTYNTTIEEKKVELLESFAAIQRVLAFAGVPEASMCNLKDRESKEEFVEYLRQAQTYSHCFPKLNVKELLSDLAKSWELLCEMNCMARNSAQRKLLALKADPKSDPAVIQDAEATKARVDGLCTVTNMELYRIRALFKTYSHAVSK